MSLSTSALARKSAAVLLAVSLAAFAGVFSVRADHVAGHKDPAMKMADGQTTSTFAGSKANSGTATASHDNGKLTLTWSDDFKIPSTPAPHWQVVDSSGNTYLLQRLVIKGDKFNKTITVPSYVKDIARVQIWCAYAEVLLGEAPFAQPVK